MTTKMYIISKKNSICGNAIKN